MNSKKQHYIINNLLCSPDLTAKCIDIIKPSYFEPEFIPHVKFLLEYHLTHNSNPSVDLMNAECNQEDDLEYKQIKIPSDEFDYSCEEIESFCKQSAMRDAILDSYDFIKEKKFDEVYKKVSDALNVSLKKDLGLNVYDDPEERLKSLIEKFEYISTGIKGLDQYLGGGLLERMLYLFSANSGGGKSVMLSNLGNNLSLGGKNVVYISLELPEDMVFLRQAFIMTSFSHRIWKNKIIEIASKIKKFKDYGAGEFQIIRMPIGSNANNIRSYLKQYEIENGYSPDVLIVDYLDLMNPIGGTKGLGISEQDKAKSEEIYELLHMYNMTGLSASQQNRDALRMSSPNQSGIAGGLSKINICDYYMSIYMDEGMRLSGDMLVYFLKTRYSDGHGKNTLLSFDDASLKIQDHENPESVESVIKNMINKKNKKNTTKEEKMVNNLVIDGELELPNSETQNDKKINEKMDKIKDTIVDFSDENDEEDNNEQIISLMNALQTN